ncbi:E3 ubiquitin/ISG15 ligase TRIM25-like [Erpetoichthys calabaricus]|uniref:E3 ubiquitin/ISG15 ligase TRIM25-like n=1 Tax=Erpetoichthys calabaricus TaxID=27687 RepID=UPI002234A354|nr:E3 ubiquitin/ISG15 ligase TRIM25-like [Erpetoichthys calabaricus]
MFELEDDFTCSICLEVLNEPVSVPCGHSFCLACINKYWDQAEVCKCPQCREIFNPRPHLRKTTLLAEVMEKLKMKQPHSRVAKHFDGSAVIVCDFCSGEKLRAVKSCMTCLTSFCEIHIKHHNEIVAWKNHKLVNPTANIQEKLCKKHQKVLEIYCRSDETCICSLCVTTGHKDHDTAQPEMERATKQIQLGATLTEIKQNIEKKENQIEDITQIIQRVKVSM